MKSVLCLLLPMLLTGLLQARPVRLWKTDELEKISTLVVVASVIETEKTERTLKVHAEGYQAIMTRIHQATLKVERVVLGSAPPPLVIEYGRLIMGDEPVINGPGRVYLEKGKRYLFYLKKHKDGPHYPVLEMTYDSDQSVQPAPKEPPARP